MIKDNLSIEDIRRLSPEEIDREIMCLIFQQGDTIERMRLLLEDGSRAIKEFDDSQKNDI